MKGLSPTTSDAGSPEKRGLDSSQTGPKRQQNTMLLMNAMKTTAAHSKIPFTPASASLNHQQGENEGQNSETPKTTVVSSSATPAPHTGSGSFQTGVQETGGGGGGGVKKKKKSVFILFSSTHSCASTMGSFRRLSGATSCSSLKSSFV